MTPSDRHGPCLSGLGIPALFTFSLAQTADGWRITGWAWSTL